MLATRYLIVKIIQHITLLWLVVAGMSLVLEMIAQSHAMSNDQYTLTHALYYTLMMTPRNSYQLCPMIGLFGATLALVRLQMSQELTALQAAGFGSWHLQSALMISALIFMTTTLLIGEGLSPFMENKAHHWKARIVDKRDSSALFTPLWMQTNRGFLVASQIQSPTELADLTLFHIDAHQNVLQSSFQKAVHRDGDTWQLVPIIDSDSLLQAQPNQLPTIDLDLPITPKALKHVLNPVSKTPLWRAIALWSQKNQASSLSLTLGIDLFQRLNQPMIVLLMLFLASPCAVVPFQRVNTIASITKVLSIALVLYICMAIVATISHAATTQSLWVILIPNLMLIIVRLCFFAIHRGWFRPWLPILRRH